MVACYGVPSDITVALAIRHVLLHQPATPRTFCEGPHPPDSGPWFASARSASPPRRLSPPVHQIRTQTATYLLLPQLRFPSPPPPQPPLLTFASLSPPPDSSGPFMSGPPEYLNPTLIRISSRPISLVSISSSRPSLIILFGKVSSCTSGHSTIAFSLFFFRLADRTSAPAAAVWAGYKCRPLNR
ncbi:hypothetical protein L209DRAFT_439560 [Thermothelomyces heterothallicus CBS 203.75]